MGDIPKGGGGGATAGSGWVKVSDVAAPGGVVSNQVWQDSPNNTVLQSATVSQLSITMHIRCSYPIVLVDGNPVTLSEATDGGHYEDSAVAVTLSGSGAISVVAQDTDGNTGAQDTITFAVVLPAQMTALSFTGSYPGSQTELKENDTFQITGTTDSDIDLVEIQDFGACKFASIAVPTGTSFTVTGTIDDEGNANTARPARVRVRDATSGAFSTLRDTNELGGTTDGVDLVFCNNLSPTVSFGAKTYPLTQSALKGSESADVGVSIANADSILFDSPTSELSIADPGLIEATKTVTRIAGTYNVSTNNLRATATRNANDSTTVDQTVVNIAAVAAQFTVSPATARVRSGTGSGNDTTITFTSDQQLQAAPTLDEAVGAGTFQGSWSGGPTSWTRDLRVTDAENPADGSSHTWLNPSGTNLAGIVTSTVSVGATYVIGGFTTRTINFAAFTADSTETFPLTDESKLSAGSFSNGNPAVVQPFGTADTTDVGKEGWCAPTAASGTAVQMHMLHSPTVAANSGGLTLTLVEETA